MEDLVYSLSYLQDIWNDQMRELLTDLSKELVEIKDSMKANGFSPKFWDKTIFHALNGHKDTCPNIEYYSEQFGRAFERLQATSADIQDHIQDGNELPIDARGSNQKSVFEGIKQFYDNKCHPH